MSRSVYSAPRTAAPSTSGTPLLHTPARVTRQERPPCAHGTVQFCEIKISLCLLDFEGCGSLDLSEIYQFSPSKRCAFDFRHPTFAYPRARHTPGAPALRTWNLGLLDILCFFAVFAPLRRMRIARSRRDLSIQPLETLRLRLPAPHFCVPTPESHSRSARLAHM